MPTLPPLAPLTSISRPLSLSEYYHACIATSRFTLEKPREVVLVLRGEASPVTPDWQSAIGRLARVHPGACLRLLGKRSLARWQSDGKPPRLRLVEGCAWDGCSDQGADFITATPLSLVHGPTIELIVAQGHGGAMTVILRALHAVIDGRGGMLLLADLFRALRGETLLGSNAAYSDFDYRRSIGKSPFPPRPRPAPWPAAATGGTDIGDMFRRISLGPPKPGLMAHVAVAIAAFVHRQSDDPVLLGVPADMRIHVPGLLTPANFTNMMTLRIDKGATASQFRQQVRERLAHLATAGYPDLSDRLKWLPFPWLDLLVSRTRRSYRKRKPAMTATLSNLGRIGRAAYSAPGFLPRDLVLLPIPGDVFATLACVDDRVEMMLGMPRILADEQMLANFADFMQDSLARA